MPIYEYRCNECGEVSEVFLLSKEETPTCKGCGATDLVKLMSAHNATGFAVPPMKTGCSACGSSPDCCGSVGSCGNAGSCCAN
jgi:putative FmdB family regulatory protein